MVGCGRTGRPRLEEEDMVAAGRSEARNGNVVWGNSDYWAVGVIHG